MSGGHSDSVGVVEAVELGGHPGISGKSLERDLALEMWPVEDHTSIKRMSVVVFFKTLL